jgi:hypothetical protein
MRHRPSVRRGDARALSEKVVVGARNRVDYPAILADKQRRRLGARLAKPDACAPTATVFVAADQPLAAVWTGQAWVFAEDPTLAYDQSSPRAALRSLVRASRSAALGCASRARPGAVPPRALRGRPAPSVVRRRVREPRYKQPATVSRSTSPIPSSAMPTRRCSSSATARRPTSNARAHAGSSSTSERRLDAITPGRVGTRRTADGANTVLAILHHQR